MKEWLIKIEDGISCRHSNHHKRVRGCTVSSRKKKEMSAKKLMRTIEQLERHGKRVRAIYAVGTTVAKKIINVAEFEKRDIKIVCSRHPTSVLHDTSGSYDAKTGTFVFFVFEIQIHFSYSTLTIFLHTK